MSGKTIAGALEVVPNGKRAFFAVDIISGKHFLIDNHFTSQLGRLDQCGKNMHGDSLYKQCSVAINHRRYLHYSDAATSVVGEREFLTLEKPIGTTEFESASATPIAARILF